MLQFLEVEMDLSAENLKNLEQQGKDMEKEGHFDSKSILKSIKDFDKRLLSQIMLSGML